MTGSLVAEDGITRVPQIQGLLCMRALFEDGSELEDCRWVRSRLGGVRTRFSANQVGAQITGVPEFVLRYSSGGMEFAVPGLVDKRYDDRVNCLEQQPSGERSNCLVEVEFVVGFTLPIAWIEWLQANGIDSEGAILW